MSRENVEIVQAAYRAINEADEETFVKLSADDVVLETGLLLDQGTFHGPEGVRAYAQALRDVWGDTVRSYPEEITEHGDHVLVMARTSARGRASGAATDARIAHLWTLRAGKIDLCRTFRTREEALGAVGLRE
jgi:ketosteroid isomerase-like protein